MKHLLLSIAALGIGCATSKPVGAPQTARAVPEPTRTTPPTAMTTPAEVAAEFALTTYVAEPTRTHGVVCVELAATEDSRKVLDRLSPLASRLSVDRNDCGTEPSAILSIGPSQVAGDRARVDVGVVRGSAGMLELERRDGAWLVVRATSPWISLR
ncbi:MAG TPA: hypothetical protein VE911_07015 [Candidatus Nitrosopolaris sp.]|nr:hypothetical protein [Candidatus Nitrosopolaris sp.]